MSKSAAQSLVASEHFFALFLSFLKSCRSKIRSSLPDVTVNWSSCQFVGVVIHSSVGSLEVQLVIFTQIQQEVNQFRCTELVTWRFAYFIPFCSFFCVSNKTQCTNPMWWRDFLRITHLTHFKHFNAHMFRRKARNEVAVRQLCTVWHHKGKCDVWVVCVWVASGCSINCKEWMFRSSGSCKHQECEFYSDISTKCCLCICSAHVHHHDHEQ